MLHFLLTSAVAAALVVPAVPLHAQDAIALRAVRYYRNDGGRSLVKTFIQVPYALLEPSGTGPDAVLTYTVSARVLDGTGMSLLPEAMAWKGRVPATFKAPRAVGLEQMEFALTPGKFRVEVSVEDSVSGRKYQAAADIDGYPAVPPASDLLLSPAMRLADANDTVPQPGEMRAGNTLIVPAAMVRLTPLRPKLYYFLEAYIAPGEEQAGTMQVSVLGSPVKTAPAPVRVPGGGGMLKGQLDLEGLPEGRYTLQVSITLGGRTTERTAEFEMAGLSETLIADTAALAAARSTDEGYFAAMNEAQLDTAAAPLVLIARSRELGAYKDLSLVAKRRFLAEFWKSRDQQPQTERNEERERFYGAIAYANKQFQVGRGKQELGWQTDRGRVYTRHGAPDDMLRRVPTGEAPAYEVWRYTRGRPRYYVFADRTGFGGFNLIQSNDLQETGIPTWREILKEDAVRDVGLFLGVDFYGSSGG